MVHMMTLTGPGETRTVPHHDASGGLRPQGQGHSEQPETDTLPARHGVGASDPFFIGRGVNLFTVSQRLAYW